MPQLPNEIWANVRRHVPSKRDRGRLAGSLGTREMDWAEVNEREEMVRSERQYIRTEYLKAAWKSNIGKVMQILQRYGADYLGKDVLFKPFAGLSQYAPRDPDVIRLILNAGLEASMDIPSVLTLMYIYHDKSNIIHMLVEEYGLIGEVERDSKYCLMVQEHLQEMGYQVNCS